MRSIPLAGERNPADAGTKPHNKITPMKTPHPANGARTQGFTLIELLVVISIIAILAGFALPVLTSAQRKGRISNTVNNAHQIGLAMKMYAGDNNGSYPAFKDAPTNSQQIATSNDAMTALMPKYTNNVTIFGNPASFYCKNAPANTVPNTVGTKQCDWSYVYGLSDTSDSRWPLFATAFANSQGTYAVGSTSVAGGVWGGTDAVIGCVDGSTKAIGSLVIQGTTSYVPRTDVGGNPAPNMFVPDPNAATLWLSDGAAANGNANGVSTGTIMMPM